MKNQIKNTLQVVAVFLMAFTATAFASGVATGDEFNLLDMARPILDAAMAGHYLAAFAFALVLSMAALKKYAPEKYGIKTFVRSDVGGVMTTFGMSFFGAIATATLATKGFAGLSLGLMKMAGGIGFLAIGGYVGIKKLVVPLLKKYQSKFPAWTAPGFVLVYFLFDRPDPIAKAESAGEAAVAATPAPGAANPSNTTDI